MRSSSIKHVCLENIRQRSSLAIIYSVLLTVIMPVLVLLTKTAEGDNLPNFMEQLLSLNMIYAATVMMFTFISSVSIFSYMHKKRSVDFYGSLPVSRREEFFGRVIAEYLIMSVPMLIIAVLGGLVAFEMKAFLMILYFALRLLVVIFASVAFTGFLAVCSGTVAGTAVNYILINSIYPIFMLIILGMPEMLPGYVSEFKNAIVLSVFSPFLSPFFMIDATIGQLAWILSIMAVVSIGLMYLSYRLIIKRKAESAQSKAAFPIPSIAVRLMTSFTAGYVGAFIFYAMFRINYIIFGGYREPQESSITSLSALGIFILGFTLFSFLAHFILHLIYNRGMRGFVKGLILYGAQLGFCLIMLGVIVTGAFGYVTRIPDEDDIKYIVLSSEDDYGRVVYHGEDLTAVKITQGFDIRRVRQIHQSIIDEAVDENNNIYMSLFTAMFEDFYDNCKLKYTLKDGSVLVRSYKGSSFSEIYEEYEDSVSKNVLEKVDPEDYESIIISHGAEDYAVYPEDLKDKQPAVDIVNAFKSDFERLGKQQLSDTDDYQISFSLDSYTMYFYFNSEYTETIKQYREHLNTE